MGCTNLTALGTTWELGLVQVFNPSTVTVNVGWNTMMLSNAFEWDGLSNIIVEVCSTEGPPYSNYTTSCVSQYTTTTFTSCLYSYTDSFDMCPDLTNWITATNNRPNIQFHYCSIVPNPANYTYLWTTGSGTIASPTSQNTTGTPAATTDYIVTVTDILGGCFDTDTITVTVINISTLTITPAGPYCVNGSTDTLQVSVPLGTGLFSGPGITNTTLGIFDPATAGVGTHQIIYAVSGACGTGADTINIVVIPQPDPTITPVGNQCASAPAITLNAVTAGGTWSGPGITSASGGTFDPATAGVGIHTITYDITTPCLAQDTVLITVTSQLNATITSMVGPFCTTASSVTLTSVDPGGTWTGAGITNATTGVFDPATAGPGSHIITYTISGMCGAMDTSLIVVVATPIISFVADTTEGCEPTTITFTSTVNQPGGIYSWTFGEGGTSNVANPAYTYLVDGGPYDVTLTYTNATGCTAISTQLALITIHSQPIALYSAGPQPTSITNPLINFTDNSLGLIDTWEWTFGTLGTSNNQNTYFVFPDTGYYPIQLIVTNNFGCTDTVDGNIVIDPIVVFYAPNAFTPNHNGLNDEFTVFADGIDYSTFEMRIYDRWGECIFRSDDITKGWNGRRNNNPDLEVVQVEVYVWKVNFTDFQGVGRQYLGTVTIVK